jgi:membrane-associated protease RseP (regulator of RpoE activity)
MLKIAVCGSIALLASGCAMQMVQHDAASACAAQGKQTFIVDSRQSGVPLFIESAGVTYYCVGADEIMHLPVIFGADAIRVSNIQGAGIIMVAPGSIADKAGLKPNDVVTGLRGRPVASAADLRSAILEMVPGDQAGIQVRRNGKDTTLSAQF